jgi:hypothetical protein
MGSPYVGVQKEALYTQSTAALLANRFVDLIKSTNITAYSTFGSSPDGIVAGPSSLDGTVYRTSMTLFHNLTQNFWVKLFSAVTAKGTPLVCVASGQVAPSSYTVINSKEVTAPAVDGIYRVPAAGWTGHENTIATRLSASWTYVVMDTTTAGTVLFDTIEGRYYVWTGTAWTLAPVVCYAGDTGVAGDEIMAYNTKPIVSIDRNMLPIGNFTILAVGASVSETDSDATITVSDDRILSTDYAFPLSLVCANAVTIKTTVCTSKTITFTLSGNGGAGCIITYAVIRALA